MEEHICSICGKKIGFGRQKIHLSDGHGIINTYCSKCYTDIPKEEKLKLEPLKNIKSADALLGFAIGGVAGAAGWSSQQNESIMKPIKQFNLSLKDINKYSIMKFNKHFLLCDGTLKGGIMMSLGNELKKEKLDELSKQHFLKDFESLERKEKKAVKKELKGFLKTNMKNNKELKNFKIFLKREGFQ